MKTPEEAAKELAQWVIDNRYPKSENNKVSDFEMYQYIISEWQASNKPEQGMKWRKCSDGMPDFYSGVIFRYIHTKTPVLDAEFLFEKHPNEKKVIEWLDESHEPYTIPSHPETKEGEKEAK